MAHLTRTRLESPVGDLTLILADGVLCTLDFEDHADRCETLLTRRFGAVSIEPSTPDDPPTAPVADRLRRYFAGELTAIEDLPVDPRGTPFQQTVWLSLRTIPAGQTLSYGALADRLGRPTASRAVGLANGANPIAIVLPCHRVIGADGSLTGYGGGLDRKRWLLQHEGVLERGLL